MKGFEFLGASVEKAGDGWELVVRIGNPGTSLNAISGDSFHDFPELADLVNSPLVQFSISSKITTEDSLAAMVTAGALMAAFAKTFEKPEPAK